MSFVQQRIENFLSQSVISDEFSHTVLHRQRPPPPSAAAPPPPKRSGGAKKIEPRPAAPKRSDPAAIYGVPMKQAPRRPGAAAALRGQGFAGNAHRAAAAKLKQKQDEVKKLQAAAMEKKRKEIEERDQKRKEELKRQKEKYEEQLKLQQQQMAERQKLARMQKARDEAVSQWHKTLVAPESRPLPPPPAPAPKLSDKENQKEKLPVAAVEERAPLMPAPKAAFPERPKPNRAKIVNEFLDRRRAAAANKAKAEFQLGGQADDLEKLKNLGVGGGGPDVAAAAHPKNAGEQEYLARLAAIRRNNFHERKAIMMKYNPSAFAPPSREGAQGSPLQSRDDPGFDPEARKRKIEALRAQADLQAAQIKERLAQKKRLEEEEKRRKEPVIPLESALKEVGVTRVLDKPAKSNDIPDEPEARRKWGAKPSDPMSLAQKNLEETASAMEATTAEDRVEVSAPAARRKWAEPATPDIARMHQFDLQKTFTIAPPKDETDGQQILATVPEAEPSPTAVAAPVEAGKQSGKGPVTVEQVLQAADAPTKPSSPEKDAAEAAISEKKNEDKAPEASNQSVVEDDVKVEDIENEEKGEDEVKKGDGPLPSQNVVNTVEDVSKSPENDQSEDKNYKNSMSEGLKTGAFDFNVKLLRTCSLPDLRKPLDLPIDDSPLVQTPVEPENVPVESENVPDGAESNADEAVDGETPSEEAEIIEEEEKAMSSDEEDMQEMLATMANVLQERWSNGNNQEEEEEDIDEDDRESDEDTQFGDGDDREDPGSVLNESWHSDDDDDGEEKRSDGESDSENSGSVFHRLELTRHELEQQLGLDKFMRVYRFLQTIQEEGDDQVNFGSETVDEVGKMLGQDNATAYPKILKLVAADAAYFEANNASLEEANELEDQ